MLWFSVFGLWVTLLTCKVSQSIPDSQIHIQAACVDVDGDHDEDHGDKVPVWFENGSSTLDCPPIYH